MAERSLGIAQTPAGVEGFASRGCRFPKSKTRGRTASSLSSLPWMCSCSIHTMSVGFRRSSGEVFRFENHCPYSITRDPGSREKLQQDTTGYKSRSEDVDVPFLSWPGKQAKLPKLQVHQNSQMQNLMQLESSRTLVLIARVRVMVAWRGDFTANLKHQNWPIRHLELRGSASFYCKGHAASSHTCPGVRVQKPQTGMVVISPTLVMSRKTLGQCCLE